MYICTLIAVGRSPPSKTFPILGGFYVFFFNYCKNTYLLTPRCRVLLEKLTGLQLVEKFPAFHGVRRFITALTSVRHLSLSWASPIQSIHPHPNLLEIHPNIIHPSTPRSPWWYLSLRFPHQDPIHPLSSSIHAKCQAHFMLSTYNKILKTKMKLNFSKTQSVPRSKHTPSRL